MGEEKIGKRHILDNPATDLTDETGQPFELLQWQRDEIVRRHKRTFVEIPKKNGKSTLASGIEPERGV